jgi:diadenosine tetraphosphate (Ap4A) HIT family hydrolase
VIEVAHADPGAEDPGSGSPEPGCVFCEPDRQPRALFETARTRVIPDREPLVPGHTLVLSRPHYRCLALADDATLAEVDSSAARVAPFLGDAYGVEPIEWENGISGHLIPVRLPADLHLPVEGPDCEEIDGWEAVRRRFAAEGRYHYLALRGHRYALAGDGPASWDLRRAFAQAAGLRFDGERFVRPTTPADVEELLRRWEASAA